MTQPKILGVIPARYASSRLPGKPLLEIGGKTMLEHVYRRACARPQDIRRGGEIRRRRRDDARRPSGRLEPRSRDSGENRHRLCNQHTGRRADARPENARRTRARPHRGPGGRLRDRLRADNARRGLPQPEHRQGRTDARSTSAARRYPTREIPRAAPYGSTSAYTPSRRNSC